MSMLFFCDSKNNILLHPYVYKMSKELSLLDEKEILFLIYAYDYNSIFRQFSEHERIRRSCWKVYGDNKPNLTNIEKHSQILKAAIEAYKGLQYNRNIESIETYNKKIDKLTMLLEADDSSMGISKNLASIDTLRKAIRLIEAEVLEEKLLDGQLTGKVQLSWIEKAKQNTKQYQSMISKRG